MMFSVTDLYAIEIRELCALLLEVNSSFAYDLLVHWGCLKGFSICHLSPEIKGQKDSCGPSYNRYYHAFLCTRLARPLLGKSGTSFETEQVWSFEEKSATLFRELVPGDLREQG